MVITQYRSRLKPTGSRYKSYRKKRKYESGRTPALTKIGSRKTRTERKIGGRSKIRLMQAETVNVLDQKTKKFQKAKILTVVDSPANKHYVRRNIVVKGSIINTDLGKAKVTNRPGQEGQINAVLV